MNYLVIDEEGLAINAATWDGITPWTLPPGHVAVAAPTEPPVWIGWTRSQGGGWAPPTEPSPE